MADSIYREMIAKAHRYGDRHGKHGTGEGLLKEILAGPVPSFSWSFQDGNHQERETVYWLKNGGFLYHETARDVNEKYTLVWDHMEVGHMAADVHGHCVFGHSHYVEKGKITAGSDHEAEWDRNRSLEFGDYMTMLSAKPPTVEQLRNYLSQPDSSPSVYLTLSDAGTATDIVAAELAMDRIYRHTRRLRSLHQEYQIPVGGEAEYFTDSYMDLTRQCGMSKFFTVKRLEELAGQCVQNNREIHRGPKGPGI